MVWVPIRAEDAEYIPSHYSKREYQIPMRDGARMFTAVYSPKDTAQACPLLMIRTEQVRLSMPQVVFKGAQVPSM